MATVKRSEFKGLLQKNLPILRKNLMALMKDQGINRSLLASLIDRDRKYTNYLFNHPAANPGYDTICALAHVLNVDVSELFKN